MKIRKFTEAELEVYGIIEIEGDNEMRKYIQQELNKAGFVRGHPVESRFDYNTKQIIMTQEED